MRKDGLESFEICRDVPVYSFSETIFLNSLSFSVCPFGSYQREQRSEVKKVIHRAKRVHVYRSSKRECNKMNNINTNNLNRYKGTRTFQLHPT